MTLSAVFGSAAVLSALRERDCLVGGEKLVLDDAKPIHKAFPLVVNEQRYDVAELALVTFLQAFDAGRPLCLLPVTLLGRFQHHCLVTLEGSGVDLAHGLAGKRIGVRSWGQTTGVWVRGILGDEFGVDVTGPEWVTYEGGHLAGARDPDFVTRAPAGARLPDDFLAGRVDVAILGNELPDDPRVRTVLPDPARAAASWYGRTGAIPVNHMAVVTDEIAAKHPDVVAELCGLLAGAAPPRPRIGSSPDFNPAGFAALAPSLDLAGRYAHRQGLTSRAITTREVRAKLEDLTGLDLGRVPPVVHNDVKP